MSQPIKNREAFFDYLEEGLQAYFDGHDRLFGGIIHLTVGVREGQVGGIIKSEDMLHYSGFTLDRVREILKYVLPKYVARTEVPLAVDAVIEELRMEKEEVSPSQARKRDSSGKINLPSSQPMLLASAKGGVTRTARKKRNSKQSTQNSKQEQQQ